MASITLEGVRLDRGEHRILDGVDLVAEDGEILGLIGPSGAGKTSIIRAIAGFDPISAGRIVFDDEDVTSTPTRDRDVAIVFQENTLLATQRVRSNLAFPLRFRSVARAEIDKRVEAEARAQHIAHILERWPSTLSGGEQQLTQLARALVRVPRVLLLDEPMAQLDAPTRRRLREELLTLQRGYGVTTIHASNHPDEVMRMPDRLAAVEAGRVTQIGTPQEVFAQPISTSIARLTGPLATLPARLVAAEEQGVWVEAEGIRLRAWAPALGARVGQSVLIGVRPRHVHVDDRGEAQVQVGALAYESGRAERTLHLPGGSVSTTETDLDEGASARVRFDRWHLFDGEGRRLVTVG